MSELSLSLIIPIFNADTDINNIINIAKKIKNSFELLLINDGSTDNSASVCRDAAQQYNFIRFIDKPHTGVSDTRNIGLKAARGKYILFLDVDDSLADGSADKLYDFFEECGDIVDLITYPIETRYKGQVLAPHFRYQTLTYSGIYDLNDLPYIGQTTMNIMVRNLFEDNILFDTTMTFSEDQKYCCQIVKSKMKIGFCNEAKYVYNRSEISSSARSNGACYIYEQSMKMFEDIFGEGPVPLAFQGLYINDLAWKLRSNILYPYHYKDEKFYNAINRINRLLSYVGNRVILDHPEIDFFHKYYWLTQKPNNGIQPFFTVNNFGLKDRIGVILLQDNIEIVVTRIRADGNKLIFRGFLKSVAFAFTEKPKLSAVINGEKKVQEIYDSAHSYYLCHTKTNQFYAFCFETNIDDFNNLEFFVELGGYEYRCTYYFMPKIPFSHELSRYDAPIGKITLHFDRDTSVFSKSYIMPEVVLLKNGNLLPYKVNTLRHKATKLRYKKNIWIYYDCRGVGKDNGWYRFKKDYGKKDGILRIYIYDCGQCVDKFLFDGIRKKDLIPFGSEKHKLYCLACSKIITAYIEDGNILPFEQQELHLYSDFFDFKVEYIQHGILHASLPWKYSPEIIFADKVAVSTDYEIKLFTEKYRFRSQDVIPMIMPRLKELDKTAKPQRKILFAPSWRQYLIGSNVNGEWHPLKELFINSDYFKGITNFLNSDKLKELLRQYDYTLELKLHPIFSVYRECFEIESDRVRIVDSDEPIEQYDIFITDFSSFVFDFIWLGRKVFSYIPDKIQFECGMNSYREIEPISKNLLKELEMNNLDMIFADDFENSTLEYFL